MARARHPVLHAAALAAVLIATAAAAQDTAPVRHIGIYVQPYYAAGKTPQDPPIVKVGEKFDALLSSTRKADIEAASKLVKSQPQLVTPMTMMVLAIRLYDVGLRDESVFWFYAAKDRFLTLAEVIDMRTPAFAPVEDAVRNFATLAGPFINSYAFCNLAKQREARVRSVAWVEANPYQALFTEQFRARPGDRAANLRKAIEGLRSSAERERQHFADPRNVEQFNKTRKANQVEARFCWTK